MMIVMLFVLTKLLIVNSFGAPPLTLKDQATEKLVTMLNAGDSKVKELLDHPENMPNELLSEIVKNLSPSAFYSCNDSARLIWSKYSENSGYTSFPNPVLEGPYSGGVLIGPLMDTKNDWNRGRPASMTRELYITRCINLNRKDKRQLIRNWVNNGSLVKSQPKQGCFPMSMNYVKVWLWVLKRTQGRGYLTNADFPHITGFDPHYLWTTSVALNGGRLELTNGSSGFPGVCRCIGEY